jgi:hypothetical protein
MSNNQGGGLMGILRNLRKNKKEELRILHQSQTRNRNRSKNMTTKLEANRAWMILLFK